MKKEGNTGNIREVFSYGDAQSQAAVLERTVQEDAETEGLSPNHETQNNVEPDLKRKALFRKDNNVFNFF